MQRVDAAGAHERLPAAEQREQRERRDHGAGPRRAQQRPARARAARPPRRRRAPAGAAARRRASRRSGPAAARAATTRSASRTASSTSCVTSSTVRGSRASAAASQRCICSRVSASSAPNGSSRQSTGRPASSVRRNATRWRIPPESAARAGALEALEPERREVLVRGRRAPPPATRPPTRSASPALSSALSHGSSASRWGISAAGAGAHAAGVRRDQAADELEQRRLAAAARPDDRDDLARRHPQRHATQRPDGSERHRRRRRSRRPPALTSRGSATGASASLCIAPSAGITPQVRRVRSSADLSQPGVLPSPPGFLARFSVLNRLFGWSVKQQRQRRMRTGVPVGTVRASQRTSALVTRTQPWERALPSRSRRLAPERPWMAMRPGPPP